MESTIASKYFSTVPSRRVLSGVAWTLTGLGSSQAIRLASNLILTRILFPEAFGVMTIVNVFYLGLGMFSDIGIGPSIIQSRRGTDPAFLNTAWTIQVMRGIALWAIMCLIAYPVSLVYCENLLLWILPAVGLNAVIGGLRSTKVFEANRRLDLKRITVIETISQLTSAVAMVALALVFHSVWSLVFGSSLGSIVSVLLTHYWLPGANNRLCWDRSSAVELLTFGKWIFASTAFTFLGKQADKLILGLFLTSGTLGVYGIARVANEVVDKIVTTLIARVIFPSFSGLNHLPPHEFTSRIRTKRFAAVLAWAICCAVVSTFVDVGINSLWDSRYVDAGWMAGLLSLGVLMSGLFSLNVKVLTSRGISKNQAVAQFVLACTTCGGCTIGYYLAAMPGALFATAAGSILPYLITERAVARRGLGFLRQDVAAICLYLVSSSAFILARYYCGFGLPAWLSALSGR